MACRSQVCASFAYRSQRPTECWAVSFICCARFGLAYRTLANSVANALFGSCSRFRPPRRCSTGRLLVAALVRCAGGVRCSGLAALMGPGPFTATETPLEGCAGLARRTLSSRGARSNRRMIACISSDVGASINANPFDSCVSWFRMTLTESATRSSAASHCLMSSAVTHMGKLPKKTVKLIQLLCSLRGWKFFGGSTKGGNPIFLPAR